MLSSSGFDVQVPADLLTAKPATSGDLGRKVSPNLSTYHVASDMDRVVPASGDVNAPLVMLPGANPGSDHGGSLGYDPNKPMSFVIDKNTPNSCVVDHSQLTPQLIQRCHDLFRQRFKGDPSGAGPLLSSIIKEQLACTDPATGTSLSYLNTWTSDDHDPFGRTVKLPPPAAVLRDPSLRQKKESKVMDPGIATFPSGVAGNLPPHLTAAGHAASGFATNAAHEAMMRQSFAGQAGHVNTGRRVLTTAVSGQTGQSPAAPVPRIPMPEKLIRFMTPAGNFDGYYHNVQVIREPVVFNGEPTELIYLVAVINRSANPSNTHFQPVTPAPGANVVLALPDGKMYTLYQVMLKYAIKTTEHYILMVGDYNPEQENQVPAQETVPDPGADLGVPVTADEAVSDAVDME